VARPPSSVVVTHRERFSTAIESLESLLATIPAGTQVIYVDGGAPSGIARDLARAAEMHDFLLLQTDRYLSPNEARNLALPYLESEFVAFVDNDLRFTPGWLERMVECADETGAWLVSPVILQEGAHGIVIHMVGGTCGIEHIDGSVRFREDHVLMGSPLEELPPLTRHPIGYVEFHCVLASRPALDACFPLDEALRSNRDHSDLTLHVQQLGGEIWLEPSAVITELVLPDRLPRPDRGFYAVRWSDAWNRSSLARFQEKWDLDPDDPMDEHDLMWLSVHRLYGNRAYGGLFGSLPSRPRRAAIRVADRAKQATINARGLTRPRPTPAPRVAHAPTSRRGAERVIRD